MALPSAAMEASLRGKVAIVTGGAGGIGGATAALLARAGATVFIADVRDGENAVSAGIGARFLPLDVTSEAGWNDAVAAVMDAHGRIDVLVNAAGIEGDQKNNSVLTTSLADWRRVHAVNLDGTFLGCRTVLAAMERHKRGSIVNVSSVASDFPMPFNCAYGSSKAAVRHLTRSVAAWGSLNGNLIRCNSVHPGMIRTRMLYEIVGAKSPAQADPAAAAEAQARAIVPLRSLISPEEVAREIVHLASDEAGQVTGAEFRIDGGWSLAVGGWLRR